MYEMLVKSLGQSKGYDFTSHDLSWLDNHAYSTRGWIEGCNVIIDARDDAILAKRTAKDAKVKAAARAKVKHCDALFATIDAVMGY